MILCLDYTPPEKINQHKLVQKRTSIAENDFSKNMKTVSHYLLKTLDNPLFVPYYRGEYELSFTFSRRIVKKEKKMPLVMAPTGRDLRIVRILMDEKTKKHLESLGITIDATISLISVSGGSVICLIKDGRLALDKEMATKILVA